MQIKLQLIKVKMTRQSHFPCLTKIANLAVILFVLSLEILIAKTDGNEKSMSESIRAVR